MCFFYSLENLVDYVTVMFCIVYQGEPRAGKLQNLLLELVIFFIKLINYKELFTSLLIKHQVSIEFQSYVQK
jgi:hypothetical protein